MLAMTGVQTLRKNESAVSIHLNASFSQVSNMTSVSVTMTTKIIIGIPSVARRRNHFLATCSISIDLQRSVLH